MKTIKGVVKITNNHILDMKVYSEDNVISINIIPRFKDLWDRIKRSWNHFMGKPSLSDIIFSKRELDDIAKEIWKMSNNFKNEIVFNVEKTRNDAILPRKSLESAVGYDVFTPEDFSLRPGQRILIDFGFRVGQIPGYEIQMRNRSSMGWKKGVMMILGVGTIDPDYVGSIMAPLLNIGNEWIHFKRGERIAQIVIKETSNVSLKEGKVDINTLRGTGGFGSTGN